jgi:sugar lactone lactonase YvrE
MPLTNRWLLAALLISATLSAQDRYRIETFAGGPAPEGVLPTATFFTSPQGLAFDGSGNLFVGEANASRVRRIAAGSNLVSVAAGSSVPGYGGNGGSALSAVLGVPRYVALDKSGDMFISDWSNCIVWRVDGVSGNIAVYAGVPGNCGYNSDGIAATSAQLNAQRGIAVDAAGNLFIADVGNLRVRRVDVGSTHPITTVAGTGTGGYNGDGILATQANLSGPAHLALDSLGNLFIADAGDARILRVDASTGMITTYAGTGKGGYSGDNGPATSARINGMMSAEMAFDAHDNLFFLDTGDLCVRRIDAAPPNIITTYVGNGGPAPNATFSAVVGIAIDGAGAIFLADFGANVIWKVAPGSSGPVQTISTFAGSLGPDNVPPTSAFLNLPASAAVDRMGNVLIADTEDDRIRQVSGATGLISTIAGTGVPGYTDGPVLRATMSWPNDIALDAAGDYYIADYLNNVIRRVDAVTGLMTTFAGTGAGDYDGDGTATLVDLFYPEGVAVDSSGNVYIADWENNMVRKVSGGVMTTIAGTTDGAGYNGDNIPANTAQLNLPCSVAVDPNGNVYISDSGNSRVREIVQATGNIVTIAGTGVAGYNGDGPATSARLTSPGGLAVTAAGDLIIADGNMVRRIPAGQTTLATIAGSTIGGYSGDGGAATAAELDSPDHVAADGSGRIYVADSFNDAVRRLTPQYLLTTSVSPANAGTVTPGGYFDQNSTVTVSAAANSGFVFIGFTGSVTGASPATLTMNATSSVVANFAAVTTTILSPASGEYGDGVLLTATVSPAISGSQQLSGTVTFSVNGVAAGSAPVNASGVASLTYGILLNHGSYSIAAQFTSGNPAFTNSSGAETLKVTALVGQATCNGVYNGTFNGNMTVGQNCTFVGGSVSGNLTQSGGKLSLTNATVRGNLQIAGGAFSIGPAATIDGNLTVQQLAAGAGPSQICGSRISGNLQFQNNGASVTIGSGSPSCGGNTISGNLQVENNSGATIVVGNTVSGNLQDMSNTGPAQVVGNTVSGNLQCQGNSSIVGGPNTAKKPQGQCF